MRRKKNPDDNKTLEELEKKRQKQLQQEARRRMLIALRLKKDNGFRMKKKKPLPRKLRKVVAKLIQEIERHKSAPWFLYYVFAAATDVFDLIPILGIIFAIFLKPILFLLLWRHSRGARGRILALIIIDLIPFISIVPAGILSVLLTQVHSKAKAKKAKKKIREYYKDYILPPEAIAIA